MTGTSSESALGFEEWVVITIINDSKIRPIKIMGLRLDEGKFHAPGNKRHEILKHALDNLLIQAGDNLSLNSCGRDFLFNSGTKGSFNLFDVTGGAQDFICNFAWECPVGLKTNTAKIMAVGPDSKFTLEVQGFNLDSGALGKGRLICTDKKQGTAPPKGDPPGDGDGPPGESPPLGGDDGSEPPGGDDNGPPGGDNGGPPPDDGSKLPGGDDDDGGPPPDEGVPQVV